MILGYVVSLSIAMSLSPITVVYIGRLIVLIRDSEILLLGTMYVYAYIELELPRLN